MTAPVLPPPMPRTQLRPLPPGASAVVGWLLLVPALVLWLFGLVLPVLSTAYLSLTRTSAFARGPRPVGPQNYVRLLGDGSYCRALGFTALVTVVRVAAVAVVPPLLAWGAAALGRRAAIPLSVVFAVPLTFATPVFAAVATRLHAATGMSATATGARLGVLGFNGTYALL